MDFIWRQKTKEITGGESRVNFKCGEIPNRSGRSQMFFKIDVLKNFAIFTGKQLSWNLF